MQKGKKHIILPKMPVVQKETAYFLTRLKISIEYQKTSRRFMGKRKQLRPFKSVLLQNDIPNNTTSE
jgi:hypothetical protein